MLALHFLDASQFPGRDARDLELECRFKRPSLHRDAKRWEHATSLRLMYAHPLSARRRHLSAAARDDAAALAARKKSLLPAIALPLRPAGSERARSARRIIWSSRRRSPNSTELSPGGAAAAARAKPCAAAARLEPPPSTRPLLTSQACAPTRSLAGFSTSRNRAADEEPHAAATHDSCVVAAGGACGVAGEVVEIHFPTRAWCGLRAL